MNYFDYINSIEPSSDLKDKTRKKVQEEIVKKNIAIRKKRIAYISTAACFAIFATAVAMANTTKTVPNLVRNSTYSDVTDNSNEDVIKINVTDDGNKFGAQKIIIEDKVFVQYCSSGNKANWGDDNGNIVIEKSDIGDLICSLKANNLIDFEHWYDYSSMSDQEANTCQFNNAKIYEYKKCQNNTQVLVKTDSDYYLFYLSDFTSKVSSSQIFDVYSASGNNPIKEIGIIKNVDSEDNSSSFIIKDETKISSILDVLKESNDNYSLTEIISKGYTENDYENYNLIFIFDDDTELTANIHKNYFAFSVVQKDDYGNYNLSASQYDALMNFIGK